MNKNTGATRGKFRQQKIQPQFQMVSTDKKQNLAHEPNNASEYEETASDHAHRMTGPTLAAASGNFDFESPKA